MPATIEQLRDRLRSGPPLILDGAVGTELQRHGFDTHLPLWSAAALETETGRQLVRTIHRDYAAAGAEILVTNTFRANLLDTAARRAAVEDVRAACPDDRLTWIAAGVGPLADCYRPDLVPDGDTLRSTHARLADDYRDVPLAWIETIGTIREARAAAEARRAAGGDFVLSFCTREDGSLLGGEPLADAVAAIEPLEPLAFGLNCIPPAGATRTLDLLRDLTDRPPAVYAHIGNPEPILGWSFSESVTPEHYAEHAAAWMARGARIIGGCCGTTPAHIAAITRRI